MLNRAHGRAMIIAYGRGKARIDHILPVNDNLTSAVYQVCAANPDAEIFVGWFQCQRCLPAGMQGHACAANFGLECFLFNHTSDLYSVFP